MSQEDEYVQDDVVGQKDQTSGEEVTDSDDSEGTVTIPRSRYKSLRYKANGYDDLKSKPTEKPINRNSDDSAWKEKMELKVDGYTEEEVGFIMKNGGREALNDGFVKTAIDSMREQRKAEAAILGDEGQKSMSAKGLDPAKFAKMSSEDQVKALSELN